MSCRPALPCQNSSWEVLQLTATWDKAHRMPTRITPLNQPLTLVEIEETPETLTITQTKAPALRDLRNLLAGWWPVPFFLFAAAFAASSEDASPFWNHGHKISGAEWYDPPYLWGFIFFGLLFGRLLLRSLCGLFGRATFVFDKSRNMLVRNGKPVGSLGEICRIKSQLNKGYGLNPTFRLMVEIPEGRKIAIATTHYIPARGEFRVSRNRMGPASRFPYMHCWEDCDRQDMVPFKPSVARMPDSTLYILQEWDHANPHWGEFVQCLEQAAPEQLPFVLGEYSRSLPCFLCAALQENQVVGFLRFGIQPIGPEDNCPLLALDGIPLTEAKIHAFAVREERRGQGIGTALQSWAIQRAKALGCYQLVSHTNYENAANLRVKLSLGFAAHPENGSVRFLMPLRSCP